MFICIYFNLSYLINYKQISKIKVKVLWQIKSLIISDFMLIYINWN